MNTTTLPLLPLRDIVMFPLMTLPVLIGRAKSLRAFETASAGDGRMLLLAQKDSSVEAPYFDDLYRVGTVATSIRHFVLPHGHMKLLVGGLRRVTVLEITDDAGFQTGTIQPLDEYETGFDTAAGFDLKEWPFASRPEPRVAELQNLLEDGALTSAERLRRAAALMGSSRPLP